MKCPFCKAKRCVESGDRAGFAKKGGRIIVDLVGHLEDADGSDGADEGSEED